MSRPGAWFCAALPPTHRNRKHAAHGLLSLISLLRAFPLNVIKRNQAHKRRLRRRSDVPRLTNMMCPCLKTHGNTHSASAVERRQRKHPGRCSPAAAGAAWFCILEKPKNGSK